MALPRLKEVVELSTLASKVYRYLEPQEYIGRLAPSLGMILQKDLGIADIEVSEEFLDSATFLATTYFREPLVDALRVVNVSLQGVSGAVPVLSLTHAMGLGKTHFLTLLYHLYTKVPIIWNSIKERLPEESRLLTEKANYRVDTARRTLVVAIDLKHVPRERMPYDALFFNTLKIFEKYKKGFLEAEIHKAELSNFEKLLREISRYEPKDAAREFVKALSELAVSIPLLIIVDEVYAAAFEAFAGASGEYVDSVRKVLMFLTSLIDELGGTFPAVLVYASAMQDVQRWRGIIGLRVGDERELLKKAVEYFEDRTRRVAPINVRDVSEEEALEIVKKRAVRLKAPISEVLSDDVIEEIRRALSEIVGDSEATKFIEDLKKTYPFSPVYRELVRKLIVPAYSADFASERLQHLRDLIKISSVILGRVLESGEDAYLISIAHVEHDDIKHLLDEGYANEWRRNTLSWNRFLELVEAETKDHDLVKMVKGAISSVYLKSVTNNMWDLLLMMTKSPDALLPGELDRRALPQRKLILSLVGIVDIAKLGRYPEVLERLNVAPYIHSVERGESRYYYASLFGNPYQLLKDTREGEIRRLRDEEGRLKVGDAIEYVRERLKEYALVSEFKQNAPLSMEFVKVGDFEEVTAHFTEYLNKNEFTILVVSPIDMANKLLVEKARFEDILEGIKRSISKNMGKIKSPNMFAVVVPYVNEETLERLVSSLAEIRASEIVVNMLKSDMGMSKFAEHTAERHRSLLELVRKPEEEFKRIVMEIVARFREKLEIYAQQLSSAAVQNFTSDFISLFKKVVTFDPSTGNIEIHDLAISIDKQPETLGGVFASLPVWITNAVGGRLKVAGATEISASIAEWIKSIVSTDRVRKELRERGEYRYSISSIVDGLARGWRDIPIKPKSLESVESAIKNLLRGRVIQTDDKEFKLIEVDVEKDDLIIRPKEVPPPLPPPKGVGIGITGFETSGVDNVNMALGGIARNKELVRLLSVEIQVGSDAKIEVRGSLDKISGLLEVLIKYLNRYRNSITSCRLVVQLAKLYEKDEALQMVKSMGLSPGGVRLIESREQ
ncbi:Putative uncharacterized protein [Desulfurococcus amylolyticus 1221n]|uniref:Uncharacterized protein n=1 Tax=Desulfurococcus amylolyticus (strain DSM 18924 / JCM 16383 / VKM B-2413 / 1221n) TaxID=490899 RepID=B8D456_DESA1|nr:DUF499 domain-containing protein [Desulfurococcus amylolyticus]ACL10887.1 Putative uncharacterized protein [Desulfurococcus amylolyticus 1221n]